MIHYRCEKAVELANSLCQDGQLVCETIPALSKAGAFMPQTRLIYPANHAVIGRPN